VRGYPLVGRGLTPSAGPAVRRDGYTALIQATENGHTDCVRLLIDAGANKEAKNVSRDTALQLAVQNGHLDCARLLVVAAALVSRPSNTGRAAMAFGR
jgi:ankyrin repeat protein